MTATTPSGSVPTSGPSAHTISVKCAPPKSVAGHRRLTPSVKLSYATVKSSSHLVSAASAGVCHSGSGSLAKMSRSLPLDAAIPTNPYLSDYVDCIENLPNKLQLVLSELRSVDAQVKGNFMSHIHVRLLFFRAWS